MDREQRQALAAEMAELQQELTEALGGLVDELGSKLQPHEREELETEIADINELIERLKTGKVWLAVFGKTAAGKSSVVNALLGADIASVGVEFDTTTVACAYDMSATGDNPYMLVDVPGLMGDPKLEEMAVAEAKKAHGLLFVIDGEPYQDEIELFRTVKQASRTTPAIVFVNKADRLELMPSADAAVVRRRIHDKMIEFVDSESDIVYGSAQLYDRQSDRMQRQSLPLLEDRLYNNPGTLGQIVNVFDPANRAELTLETAREKILGARRNVARRVIRGYALAEAGSSIIPFGDIVATPGLLIMLTRSICKIMGEGHGVDAKKITVDVVKVCAQMMGALFVIGSIGSFAADFLGPIGWILSAAGFAGFKYQRTLVYGEALLLYIENGFSFGDDAHATIQKAKENAGTYYKALRRFRKRS
jgi:GTPase Era involved in 16S rRNA processing